MNLHLAAPEYVLIVTAIVVILTDLFISQKRLLAVISIVGLCIAAVVTVVMWTDDPQTMFNNMMVLDKFALFFKLIFMGIAAIIILASVDYVSKLKNFQGEYHALIILATLGMILMAATTDLIAIFVALELTSISLYILVGLLKDQRSTESSLKYLLLGGVASAMLLYGMALIFGFTGTTKLGEIAQFIQSLPQETVTSSPGLLLGILLIIAGFGFKVAVFPFQFWVPDVYEGAPTPITMFLSIGSKAAGFAVIIRVFTISFSGPAEFGLEWGWILAIISAISMTFGNLVALPQKNIKRLLGYSSIAHAGYLLMGVAVIGMAAGTDQLGQSGLLFYLLTFAVTGAAAFIAIIAITNKINSDQIDDFEGMGKQSPIMALTLTLALVSLAGFPPTAGFLAK
ncbi:MAG: NADH-quinone oxidoreductase subunit N, partial [Chloroflexi bacterium]|nr:NADH-quinone oxidoreductase subunit N [Chloroflexota bacterium]